tara:strand:+ start:2568 stop:2777 length:210 start_codon:yes stop_codon:yes gene_type:complete
MANVKVMSHHTGGQVRDMEGNTPGELAQQMDLTLSGTVIYVDESEAKASQQLTDGQVVSFQRSKVASGK